LKSRQLPHGLDRKTGLQRLCRLAADAMQRGNGSIGDVPQALAAVFGNQRGIDIHTVVPWLQNAETDLLQLSARANRPALIRHTHCPARGRKRKPAASELTPGSWTVTD